ncbi:MAG TPA: S46 family peptidase [Alphaproteobacteria bacterium]|nr:S46 family peptidase [Alphaproteobacteria bacterium]HAJ47876.1 S46 family peptidase [Alphaproteobacteria bacterium]
MVRKVGIALALLCAVPGAQAVEGMWMPGQAPEIAEAMRKEGLKLDPATLANLQTAPMSAIASIGGCSASFVSPQGLVASNHHCVYGSIQYNSKPERNLLRDGFVAKTLGDELPAAPGTRVFVIEELRDVTAQMNEGVVALTGKARADKLTANDKALVAACEKQPNRRCAVRSYFGGSAYYLQQQLEIKDVRLVYAPAGAIGNFGGEVDNWQWPRHTGDFGFYRAYVAADGSSAPYDVKNVPYRPKAWLKLAKDDLKAGDFVMVAGFPGTTERYRTTAETKHFYSEFYPRQQSLLSAYSDQIIAATRGNQEAVIKYANALRGADNFKKKLSGQMTGAEAIGLLAKKTTQENAFRAWAQTGERQARLAPVIASLDAIAAEAAAARMVGQTYGLINRNQLFSAARALYRWSKEREKPDADREPGFQDRDERFVRERMVQIDRRFDAKIDRKLFEAALAEYQGLGAADRNAGFDEALKKMGLDKLYAGTKLGTAEARLAWMGKTAKDFEASDDTVIKLAVASYAHDMNLDAADKDRDGRAQAARSAYIAAYREYLASQGKVAYPDANGTLRLTFGQVKGRARDGMMVAPFTTAEGILEKFTGQEPFESPARQLDLIRARDYGTYASKALKTLPVNFLSTVDITNGNSGSATVNAKGELVGLAFDGTIEGVIGDWWFDETINRTIHVDARYMRWVMDKVDGAGHLLKEMDGN